MCGPARMPTMMKPITGLMRKRAKVGMTMPAAPRMVRASDKAGVMVGSAMRSLSRRGAACHRGHPRPRSDVMTPDADLIIVGGGPAGVMAGLLFARAGCTVRILEKHADFFRDFRGDTVHPSTMEILDQLGMLERFLARPHNRLDKAELRIAGGAYTIGDLSHLHTAAPFIAMMPQWDFLDFLRGEAKAFPGFQLEMEAPVDSFIKEQGRVT